METLQKISRSTFYESFIDITPEKDMQEYIENSFNSKKLLEELKDRNSIFYFVEYHNGIIGYGKVNLNKSPYGMDEMHECMEIQRLYIVKEFQRLGVAQKLMQVFLEEAQNNELDKIWLSTGAFNNNALSFYLQFGFEKFANHIFPVGNALFEDVILLLQIKKS